MAIANYSDLLSKIAVYTWRVGDTEFTPEAADIVTMATSRLNRVLPLRVMEADTTLTVPQGVRRIALPADFLEPISLDLMTYGDARAITPFTAADLREFTAPTAPEAYAVDGDFLEFNAPADQVHTLKLRYRKSFTLSNVVPTNWLLTNHPDVMLAACLVWGGLYMRDTEELQKWKMVLEEGIEELSWLDAQSKRAPLKTELVGLWNGSFNINAG